MIRRHGSRGFSVFSGLLKDKRVPYNSIKTSGMCTATNKSLFLMVSYKKDRYFYSRGIANRKSWESPGIFGVLSHIYLNRTLVCLLSWCGSLSKWKHINQNRVWTKTTGPKVTATQSTSKIPSWLWIDSTAGSEPNRAARYEPKDRAAEVLLKICKN